MTDAPKLAYFTIVIVDLDGTNMIAAVSTYDNETHNHVMSPAVARKFAEQLVDMADYIDPPKPEWRVVESEPEIDIVSEPDEKAFAVLRRARKRVARKRKAKR